MEQIWRASRGPNVLFQGLSGCQACTRWIFMGASSISLYLQLPSFFSSLLAVSLSLCLSLDTIWVAYWCLLRPLVRFLYACESFILSSLHLSGLKKKEQLSHHIISDRTLVVKQKLKSPKKSKLGVMSNRPIISILL